MIIDIIDSEGHCSEQFVFEDGIYGYLPRFHPKRVQRRLARLKKHKVYKVAHYHGHMEIKITPKGLCLPTMMEELDNLRDSKKKSFCPPNKINYLKKFSFYPKLLIKLEEGWHGVSTPATEGVPHGGMGGVRTEIYRDRTHP